MTYRGEPFDEEYFNGGRGYGYSHYTETIKNYINLVADDIDFELGPIFGQGLKAIDIGCATGVLVEELNQRGLDTDGLDISSYAIGEANTLFPSRTFINEDIISNTIPSDTYDIIIAIGLFGCMTNQVVSSTLLNEIKRIGKTGYKAFVSLNVEGSTYLNFSEADVSAISIIGKTVTVKNLIDSGIVDDDERIRRTSIGSFGWKVLIE